MDGDARKNYFPPTKSNMRHIHPTVMGGAPGGNLSIPSLRRRSTVLGLRTSKKELAREDFVESAVSFDSSRGPTREVVLGALSKLPDLAKITERRNEDAARRISLVHSCFPLSSEEMPECMKSAMTPRQGPLSKQNEVLLSEEVRNKFLNRCFDKLRARAHVVRERFTERNIISPGPLTPLDIPSLSTTLTSKISSKSSVQKLLTRKAPKKEALGSVLSLALSLPKEDAFKLQSVKSKKGDLPELKDLRRSNAVKRQLVQLYVPMTLDVLRGDEGKQQEFAQQVARNQPKPIEYATDYHARNLREIQNMSETKKEHSTRLAQRTQHGVEVKRQKDVLDTQFMEGKLNMLEEARRERQALRNQWWTVVCLLRFCQRSRRAHMNNIVIQNSLKGVKLYSYQFQLLKSLVRSHGDGSAYCSIADAHVKGSAVDLAKSIVAKHYWKVCVALQISRKRKAVRVLVVVLRKWSFTGRLFRNFHWYKKRIQRVSEWWKGKYAMIEATHRVRALQLDRYTDLLLSLTYSKLLVKSPRQTVTSGPKSHHKSSTLLVPPSMEDLYFTARPSRRKIASRYVSTDAEYLAAARAAHPFFPTSPEAKEQAHADRMSYLYPCARELLQLSGQFHEGGQVTWRPPPRVYRMVLSFVMARDRLMFVSDYEHVCTVHQQQQAQGVAIPPLREVIRLLWKRVFLGAEAATLVAMVYALYRQEYHMRGLDLPGSTTKATSAVDLKDEESMIHFNADDMAVLDAVYCEENMDVILQQYRTLIQGWSSGQVRGTIFRKTLPKSPEQKFV